MEPRPQRAARGRASGRSTKPRHWAQMENLSSPAKFGLRIADLPCDSCLTRRRSWRCSGAARLRGCRAAAFIFSLACLFYLFVFLAPVREISEALCVCEAALMLHPMNETHTPAHTSTHMRARTHKHPHVCIHTQAPTCVYAHTSTHMCAHTHKHPHACIHTDALLSASALPSLPAASPTAPLPTLFST